MPRPIKYATVAAHDITATASASAALASDGSSNSATPSGKIRAAVLSCTATAGASIMSLGAVTGVWLSSDSAGKHPITPVTATKWGLVAPTGGTAMVGGFAIRLEMDLHISGSIYACCKLPSSDLATVVWKLTFVQGG